jgi:hypothetical protein
MIVIKTTQQVADGVVTIYTPWDSNSIFRITHYPEYVEEGEVRPEFLVIEQNLLVQNVIAVKLQKARRVKQTKEFEYFDIEEPKSAAQPMFTKVDDTEEIQSIISMLEECVCNKKNLLAD